MELTDDLDCRVPYRKALSIACKHNAPPVRGDLGSNTSATRMSTSEPRVSLLFMRWKKPITTSRLTIIPVYPSHNEARCVQPQAAEYDSEYWTYYGGLDDFLGQRLGVVQVYGLAGRRW